MWFWTTVKADNRGCCPTCDPKAVRSTGVRQDVRRRLVVLEQPLPVCRVVASEEIQSFCCRETQLIINYREQVNRQPQNQLCFKNRFYESHFVKCARWPRGWAPAPVVTLKWWLIGNGWVDVVSNCGPKLTTAEDVWSLRPQINIHILVKRDVNWNTGYNAWKSTQVDHDVHTA